MYLSAIMKYFCWQIPQNYQPSTKFSPQRVFSPRHQSSSHGRYEGAAEGAWNGISDAHFKE